MNAASHGEPLLAHPLARDVLDERPGSAFVHAMACNTPCYICQGSEERPLLGAHLNVVICSELLRKLSSQGSCELIAGEWRLSDLFH
jgi:hypothetical protein